MFGISISSAILHFVIGGLAVAIASIMAEKVGGKMGGIIATMPAVYLASNYCPCDRSSWQSISTNVNSS